ncbi:MAG: HNH endonuclease [Thermoanaerobaculia bacterium]
MKRIQRLPLSPEALSFMRKRSETVAASADPRAEAARLWRFQDNKAFREIRAILGRMAPGIERCVYCEDSHGTAIEHFWPRARYPERAFDWLNYLIACSGCNSNHKRDQFPLDSTGQPLLVNPAEEDPLDHLSFSPSTGLYQPLSPKGDPSIQVFGLNRVTLTRGRTDAWTILQQLLVRYAHSRDMADDEWAGKIETAIREHPFAGVLVALLRIAAGPAADLLISGECLQAIRSHPEIFDWA